MSYVHVMFRNCPNLCGNVKSHMCMWLLFKCILKVSLGVITLWIHVLWNRYSKKFNRSFFMIINILKLTGIQQNSIKSDVLP